MTSVSKNMCIGKLDAIVDEHNNTYRTIKMKPVDVKDNEYIDFKKEVNDKDPNYKVGDNVRTNKNKNMFAKEYTPNWSEEVVVISEIQNIVPWTYVINNLNGEKVTGTFYEKEWQRTNKKILGLKREGNKLYGKWKSYNNLFNS